jgi:hypothetical protein
VNVLVLEFRSFGDSIPGVAEQIEQQVIAAAAGSRPIGGRQDGFHLRHGERVDQPAVVQ